MKPIRNFTGKAFWALLVLFSSLLPVHPAVPEKPLGYVSDFAGILDEQTKFELNAVVTETEQKTTAEIAVVTVPSLDGRTVEDYANDLFKKWGIGKKGKDNGVLVLVSPSDRKMRIEVGYGLESILPDGLAGEVIRDEFVPAFKNGNFSLGIRNGVVKIAEIVKKGQPAQATDRGHNNINGPLLVSFMFFVAIVIGFFMLGSGIASKVLSHIIWGAALGCFFLFMTYVVFPTYLGSRWLRPFFAIFAFFQGLMSGFRNSKGYRGRYGSGSGWIGGGSFSGGFSGGGFGGFGGGSSGGGGASGSW